MSGAPRCCEGIGGVANQGDGTARDVGITHIPVVGMAVLTYTSSSAVCAPRAYNNNAVWVVHCTLPALNVGATETVRRQRGAPGEVPERIARRLTGEIFRLVNGEMSGRRRLVFPNMGVA